MCPSCFLYISRVSSFVTKSLLNKDFKILFNDLHVYKEN